MTLDAIRQLVRDDFAAVDAAIQAELRSDVVLINQLGQYLVSAGGKRLRPLLVLLMARALGYQGRDHVRLAAVIEFIHTATLLHDDVVDASDLRRGRETANALWGNEAAVLTGDFLYSRAFQMMVGAGSMRVMAVMADATNLIAEGEVLQLLNQHDPDTDEARYLEVIARKTAKLFEAGARLAAVLAEADPVREAAVAEYGLRLGTAFQLIDDVLDYTADAAEMGKNLGDDLAEGKPTLPLIRAMQVGDEAQRNLIRRAIEQGGIEHISAVQAAIQATGALDYTRAAAEREARAAQAALAALPASAYTEALHALARLAVERRA
jgi:octaprenyl-diphosphate synthase